MRPVISVLVTTYQHASFIEKCINGIVEQRLDRPIEILIGEDGSTDGTREICERFARQDPRIKVLVRDRKDVIHVMGKPTGRSNFMKLLSEAQGDHIALCEGDDHWIDKDKLARQIAALEKDGMASACFTDAYNETNGSLVPFMDAGYATSPKGKIDQKKIIEGQGIPTCTFLFRRLDLSPIRDVLKKSPVGDTILFTYIAGIGHFIYQPERTGIRSIHAGGVYSMRSTVYKLHAHLCTLPFMDEVSDHKYSDLLAARRRKLLNIAWSEATATNNRELAKYVWPKIAKERSRYGWNLTTTIRNLFKAYWPLPDRIFTMLTGR